MLYYFREKGKENKAANSGLTPRRASSRKRLKANSFKYTQDEAKHMMRYLVYL
jgi:hypothetical protein